MGKDKVEVFELDDNFDPLEDLGFDVDEELEYAGGIEYQVPVIPDADRSVVPDPVVLPPAERIAKLIEGLPGQKFRILSGIRTCAEPKTLEEASAALEELYPQGASVYSAMRIIELLADAGALERIDPEEDDGAGDEAAPANGGAGTDEQALSTPQATDGEDAEEVRIDSLSLDELDFEYDEVEPAEPSLYLATAEGLAAIEEHWSPNAAHDVVAAEPQYLQVYKTILEMCAAPQGKTKIEISDAVDSLPVLQEPRRWCQYFLENLREVNALEWDGTWRITEIGRGLLSDKIFDGVQALRQESEE